MVLAAKALPLPLLVPLLLPQLLTPLPPGVSAAVATSLGLPLADGPVLLYRPCAEQSLHKFTASGGRVAQFGWMPQPRRTLGGAGGTAGGAGGDVRDGLRWRRLHRV